MFVDKNTIYCRISWVLVLGPGSWVLGPGSCHRVLGPDFPVCQRAMLFHTNDKDSGIIGLTGQVVRHGFWRPQI